MGRGGNHALRAQKYDLKEIRFRVLEGNQFEIGDFELIEFRGNPKKPTEWKGI